MTTHLAHKLPWEALCKALHPEVYVNRRPEDRGRQPVASPRDVKAIRHFARCLAAALEEFAASDQSPAEEREHFDCTTWNDWAWGIGGWRGYYDSVIDGYIELNLLLVDTPAFSAMLLHDGRWSWTLQTLAGECDGGHPEPFASHIHEAFTERGILKEPTAEVMQILRDHAAMMFRAMHSTTAEPNSFLNANVIAREILRSFFSSYEETQERENEAT